MRINKPYAKLSRANIFAALLAVLATLSPGAIAERPNIVLFMTDDQSPMDYPYEKYYASGSFGYESTRPVHTPNIDRLAREGMVFTRAYVSSSICAASRYTTLTGRYASRSTSTDFIAANPPNAPIRVENNVELDANRPNLASKLQSNGYRTGFVGKSHIVNHKASKSADKWGTTYPLKPYPADGDVRSEKISSAMRDNHAWWQAQIARYGFDFVGAIYSGNIDLLRSDDVYAHNLEWTTASALSFIEDDDERPFFLYYATTLPHGPAPWIDGKRLAAPRVGPAAKRPAPETDKYQESFIDKIAYKLAGMVNRLVIRLFPPNQEQAAGAGERSWAEDLAAYWTEEVYPNLKWRAKYPHGLDADPRMTGEGYVEASYDFMPSRESIMREVLAQKVNPNEAWLTWVDYAVAALRQSLEARGEWDNTLVIIMSDHGAWRHGKATLHEGGLRIPLLIHWPTGIAPGSTYDGLVQNADLAPTLLEVAGITDYADLGGDGVSLLDVLRGDTAKVHDYLYAEIGYARAIITPDWKYIATRYSQEVDEQIAAGKTFVGKDAVPLERPYLTRNQHLGHHASQHNPNYFVLDQLYNLKEDPREDTNLFSPDNQVADRLKWILTEELKRLPCAPFGEFTTLPCPNQASSH